MYDIEIFIVMWQLWNNKVIGISYESYDHWQRQLWRRLLPFRFDLLIFSRFFSFLFFFHAWYVLFSSYTWCFFFPRFICHWFFYLCIKQKVDRQSITNTGFITFLGLHFSYMRHTVLFLFVFRTSITSVKYLFALIFF